METLCFSYILIKNTCYNESMGIEQGASFEQLSSNQEYQNNFPSTPLASDNARSDIKDIGGKPLTEYIDSSTMSTSLAKSADSSISITDPEPDIAPVRGIGMAQARQDRMVLPPGEVIDDMSGVQQIYHYLQAADATRMNLNHFPVRADRIADDLNVSPQEVLSYAEHLVKKGDAEKIVIAEEPFPFYRIRRAKNRRGRNNSVLRRR